MKLFTLLLAATLSATTAAQTPVIHGHIIGPREEVDYTSGMYSFPAQAPISLTCLKESRFINPNGGGDLIDGNFCYIGTNDGLDDQYNPRFYIYDASSWIPKDNYKVKDLWSASDFTYDPSTDGLYGSFTNDRTNYYFGRMDYRTTEFTPLARLELPFVVTAVSPAGMIYGLDTDGVLFAVNKSTGAKTKIGETGLHPDGRQGGAIDPVSGKLYCVITNVLEISRLYSIDLTTATATAIGEMPQQEPVHAIYFTPIIDQNAPTAPENLSATYDLASGKINISFAMPRHTISGSALTGEINYIINVDGTDQVPGAATAGETVAQSLDLNNGAHWISVSCFNGAARSKFAATEAFAFTDAPGQVTDLAYQRKGNDIILDWSAPTVGASGGQFNAEGISYQITVKTDGEEPEMFTVVLPSFKYSASGQLKEYYLEVLAIDKDGRLGTAKEVGPIMAGEPAELPLSEAFDGSKGLFAFLDANGDDCTWEFESLDNDIRTAYKYGNGNMDDWAFSHLIPLQVGKLYRLTFTTQTAGKSYRESMEIKAGLLRDPQAMLIEVAPSAKYASSAQTPNEVFFTVNADEYYHLGFHSITKGDNFFLALDNIKVEEAGVTDVPGEFTAITATAAADGALKCDVTFTTPSKSVAGNVLTSIDKVEIRLGNSVLATLTDLLPGETYTQCDLSVAQGLNTLTLQGFTSAGAGLPNSVEVYAGVDTPQAPQNVIAALGSDGRPTISWEAPAGGINGGVIVAENIRYNVRRSLDKVLVAENTPLTTITDCLGIYDLGQTIMYYEVTAENAAGSSQPAYSNHITLGTAYTLPYNETFRNGVESQGPWRGFLLDNPTGGWFVDEAGTRPSADPYDDNGGLVTFSPPAPQHSAEIISPLITLGDSQSPTLEFMVFGSATNDSRLEVAVEQDNKLTTLQDYLMSDFDGWQRVRLSLQQFSQAPLQIIFKATAGEEYENHIHLDCIKVYEVPRRDISAKALLLPAALIPGEEAQFTLIAENTGLDDLAGVTATLCIGDDESIEETLPTVPAGKQIKKVFTYAAHSGLPQTIKAKAVVAVSGDGVEDNNSVESRTLEVAHLPLPAPNAFYHEDGYETHLVWSVDANPVMRRQTLEDFESHEPFIIENLGPWTVYDIDGEGGTAGVSDGIGGIIQYPNAGEPMAFQIFNPASINFPVTEEDGIEAMYSTLSGNQMACAFADYDAVNDDWLVSEELSGEQQRISLHAKSLTDYYGLENMEILISSTTKAIADFTLLSETESVPASWTHYEYELPAGTKYFAIRCVSIDQFALCLDDIRYTAASTEPTELTLKGYNIYHGNELVLEIDDPQQTSLSLPVCDCPLNKSVSAVYAEGESRRVPFSYLESAADMQKAQFKAWTQGTNLHITQAAGQTCEIFTVQGIRIGAVTGSGQIALQKGIYILLSGETTHKIIL